MNLPTKQQLEGERSKRSFYTFVKLAWDEIETEEYLDGWYIECECKYAQAVYEGNIKDLIVLQPPRTLKSTIFSIMFPAWVLAKDPTKKFICASYSADLANDIARKFRKLVTSDWYQERFPETVIIKDTEDYVETDKGGYRISVGVNGGMTGKGCQYFIADDLLKPTEAYSDTIREATNKWYDETVTSRRNNLKTGARIIVCQRLHENDIVGHLEKKGAKYERLILPMEYEGVRFQSSIGFVDPRKEGESLHPERFDKESIEDLKIDEGENAFSAQYQLRPNLLKGNIFKKEWFINRVDNHDIVSRIISWDTASSEKEGAAYSACIVGELTSDYRLFIREVYRDKLEFPQLKTAIEDMARKYAYKLDVILIENKSSGIAAIQSLQQAVNEDVSRLILPFDPKGTKEQRGLQASLWSENGSVILPPHNEDFGFLHDFEEELFTFPNSRYKDQIDSFNQLVIYLQNYLEDGFRERRNK